MKEPRQQLAQTPRYNAWKEELRAAVSKRGAKTELARFMAAERKQPVQSWQIRISKLLNTGLMPNGEDLLAITAWMKSRTE